VILLPKELMIELISVKFILRQYCLYTTGILIGLLEKSM